MNRQLRTDPQKAGAVFREQDGTCSCHSVQYGTQIGG